MSSTVLAKGHCIKALKYCTCEVQCTCPVSLEYYEVLCSCGTAWSLPWLNSEQVICVWFGVLQASYSFDLISGLFVFFLLCPRLRGLLIPCIGTRELIRVFHKDPITLRSLVAALLLCLHCAGQSLSADVQLLQEAGEIQVAGQAPLRR